MPRLVIIYAACLLLLATSGHSQALDHSEQPLLQQAILKATPPVWPEQLKATLFGNRTNRLQLVTLYYDWKLKANLNIIASQLNKDGTVWDLEWNNGTSFIFSRDEPVCKTMHFDVGILTPDWLKESTYLGQMETDTFVCDVWTKAEFIKYYADVQTSKPVRWTFLGSGAQFHVLDWQEGQTLPKKMWQAPSYCFTNSSATANTSSSGVLNNDLATGHMMRLQAAQQIEAAVQSLQQHKRDRAQQQVYSGKVAAS